MAQVQIIQVKKDDEGIRLDRWFQRHYPELKNGQLQKLIRGKNIKVNGQKTSTDFRLSIGDEIRVPPLQIETNPLKNAPRNLSKVDIDFMKSLVIYKDKNIVVSIASLFKPNVTDRLEFIKKYIEPIFL